MTNLSKFYYQQLVSWLICYAKQPISHCSLHPSFLSQRFCAILYLKSQNADTVICSPICSQWKENTLYYAYIWDDCNTVHVCITNVTRLTIKTIRYLFATLLSFTDASGDVACSINTRPTANTTIRLLHHTVHKYTSRNFIQTHFQFIYKINTMTMPLAH